MAFEKRSTSGQYFYVSYRDPVSGKVKKRYLGHGPEAAAAAADLADRKKQRETERRDFEASRSELRVVDALMSALDGAAATLLEAALLAAGYHRENYGPWRHRRRILNGHGRHGGTTTAGCDD